LQKLQNGNINLEIFTHLVSYLLLEENIVALNSRIDGRRMFGPHLMNSSSHQVLTFYNLLGKTLQAPLRFGPELLIMRLPRDPHERQS
jgi:hypothetical protein